MSRANPNTCYSWVLPRGSITKRRSNAWPDYGCATARRRITNADCAVQSDGVSCQPNDATRAPQVGSTVRTSPAASTVDRRRATRLASQSPALSFCPQQVLVLSHTPLREFFDTCGRWWSWNNGAITWFRYWWCYFASVQLPTCFHQLTVYMKFLSVDTYKVGQKSKPLLKYTHQRSINIGWFKTNLLLAHSLGNMQQSCR